MLDPTLKAPAVSSVQPRPAVATLRLLPASYIAACAVVACLSAGHIAANALSSVSPVASVEIAAKTNSSDTATTGVIADGTSLERLRRSLDDVHRAFEQQSQSGTDQRAAPILASLTALEEQLALAASQPSPTIPSVNPKQGDANRSDTKRDEIIDSAQSVSTTPSPAPAETGSLATASKMAGQLPKMQPPTVATTQLTPATLTSGIPQPKAAADPATTVAAAAPTGAAAPASPSTVPASASAPAPSIAFGPPIVKPEPKPFGVQLASGTSLDDVQRDWLELMSRHGATLGSLKPRISISAANTPAQTFDLIAGPVKTAADAKKVCKALAAQGTDCKIAPYTGAAL